MAVFGTEEAIPACINWQKVFADAGVNGVSAICYEAVKRLPEEQRPPFGLMLRWDISALGIQQGFEARHEVTGEFRDLLSQNGLGMLLLKGETLADNYPDPSLRECGDVDFITMKAGDSAGVSNAGSPTDISNAGVSGFAECSALIGGLGLETKSQAKHVEFIYKGIHFESHDPEHTEDYNASHHRTYELLNTSLKDAALRPDGCWELEPVMQAVFVVKHMAQHVCYSGGKISLRMLLDLALLLKSHPGILDKWTPKLEYTGLKDFAEVSLCVCDKLLGTSFTSFTSSTPFRKDRSSDTDRIKIIRRADRFIHLFLTDSNEYVRYFAKLSFLPLSPGEVLRLWKEKAVSLLQRN